MDDQLLTSEEKAEVNNSGEVQKLTKTRPSYACWIGPFFFRNPRRLTIVEWIFFVVSILTLIVALVMDLRSIIVSSSPDHINNTIGFNSDYCRHISNTTTVVFVCQSDLTLGVVLLVNIGFVLYFILDGLFREQNFDMLAFVFAVSAICVYVIINYIFQAVRGDALEPWRLARFVITLVLSPINVALAGIVFWKMGFLLFDSLGANPVLHKAYKWTRVLSSIVKLNFEIFTTLFVLVVTRGLLPIGVNPLAPHPAELAVVCLLFLAGVLGIVFNTIGVYMEKKFFSMGYLVIQLCTATYYVFRIIWTSISWKENIDTINPNEVFDPTAVLAIIIILLSFAGIVLTMIIIPVYYIVMKNYGKGLKDRFFG